MQINADAKKKIVLHILVNFLADNRHLIVLYLHYFGRRVENKASTSNLTCKKLANRVLTRSWHRLVASSRLTIPGYMLTGITGADERRAAFKD